jgi:excisionase family DNA binding protein
MARIKDILTTGQVADICKVAPRTVTKWFDSGRLKGYKIPGSRDRRIPRSELMRFMKEHGIPTDQFEVGTNMALVVADEDEDSQRLILKLKDAYEIKTARSSFDAGLMIREYMPQAVFISLLSPGLDACMICQNIRSNPELAGIKVVAVADNLSRSEELALMQKGFDKCLSVQSDIATAFVGG